MLLGRAETRRLLHDVLGYDEVRGARRAFARDPGVGRGRASWSDRLERHGRRRGRGFGVKFTNTLVVENHR